MKFKKCQSLEKRMDVFVTLPSLNMGK